MSWLFTERFSSKYSIFIPATNAWWGLCCCEPAANFRYIYFYGIVPPSTFLTTAEIYTLLTNAWTSGSSAPTPGRYTPFSTSNANSEVFSTCGNATTASASGLRDHERYSFITTSWASLTDCPTPGRGFSRGGIPDLAGGRIFISMGIDTANVYLTQTDKYTESGDTWAGSTSGPAPGRQIPSMNTALNCGYVVGGTDNFLPNPSLNQNDQLDLSSETWTTKTSMSQRRTGPCVFSFGDKIYAAAGIFDNFPSASTPLNSIEEYDPATNSWTTRTSMASGGNSNAPGASDLLDLTGYYVASGGTVHREYTPDLWTTKTSASSARGTAGAGGTT